MNNIKHTTELKPCNLWVHPSDTHPDSSHYFSKCTIKVCHNLLYRFTKLPKKKKKELISKFT